MQHAPDALRHRARALLTAAQTAPPNRAAQYRRTAGELVRYALQRQLANHSATIGRRHVTPASFRQYLRDHRS